MFIGYYTYSYVPVNFFFLKKNKLQSKALRVQYSGALTLEQQEVHHNALKAAQEKKKQLEEELIEAKNKRFEVEDSLAALQLKHEGLQVLKDLSIFIIIIIIMFKIIICIYIVFWGVFR